MKYTNSGLTVEKNLTFITPSQVSNIWLDQSMSFITMTNSGGVWQAKPVSLGSTISNYNIESSVLKSSSRIYVQTKFGSGWSGSSKNFYMFFRYTKV